MTRTQSEGRDLVSIAEAAIYASVTQRTIRRYIAAGSLTGYRFGPKLIRIDLKEIDAAFRRIPAATIAQPT